jgi:plasmid stabilization system protein ParE
MAYQLIWAPSARLDLRELTSYIAESRPIAAARFVKQLSRNLPIRTSEKSFGDPVESCTGSNRRNESWRSQESGMPRGAFLNCRGSNHGGATFG